MRVLVISNNGTALGIAQRLSLEGHEVDVFSDELALSSAGGALYNVSNNLWKSIQESKFIVSDGSGTQQLYDRAKTYNKPIIGCNPLTDIMNLDAVKEYQLCERLKVPFPPSELYNDASDLHPKILDGDATRYYLKYGRKTVACTKPEWLAWAMYNLPAGKTILLQEEVKGYDLSIVGWFNGLNWVKPYFYCTPDANRIGGVAMLSVRKTSKYALNSLVRLSRWLKKIDYKGPVTAELICSKASYHITRFRIGFTAPCVFAMIEGLRDVPLGDFLNALAFGTQESVNTTNDYLVGVEVHCKSADIQGAPILGIIPENLNHIFLQSAKQDDDGDYLVGNEISQIYTASAHGRDIKEAASRVYRTIGQVQFPNMIYMTNLEGQSSSTFEQLKSWGIL